MFAEIEINPQAELTDEVRTCLQGYIDREILVIKHTGPIKSDIIIDPKAELDDNTRETIQECIDRGDLINPFSMKGFPVKEMLQQMPPHPRHVAEIMQEIEDKRG